MGWTFSIWIRPNDFKAGWYLGAYTVAEDLVRYGEVTPDRQADLYYIDSLKYYGAFDD